VVIMILLANLLFSYSITDRYFIEDDWSMLPDIGGTTLNKIFIGAHFTLGMLIMLMGPLPLFLNPPAHKIIGMIYVAACMLASLCGILFLAINTYSKGIDKGTVGGMGMTVAFGTFGILLYLTSLITSIYGWMGVKEVHREWALRTYVLGVSSFFYRVLYYVAFLFGYTIRPLHLREDFARPLDQAFNWLFFIPGLIIIECIIQFVRPFAPIIDRDHYPINIDPLYSHPFVHSQKIESIRDYEYKSLF